jgi:hypothetical protein
MSKTGLQKSMKEEEEEEDDDAECLALHPG